LRLTQPLILVQRRCLSELPSLQVVARDHLQELPLSQEYPLSTGQLHQQRFRLRIWIRTRLWAQVVLGSVAGLAVGALLGPDSGLLSAAAAEILGAWFALPGRLFLGLIDMVLVPLIFASVVRGLTGAESGEELKRVGLRLTVYVAATTLAAATNGIVLADTFQPGAGLAEVFSGQLEEAEAPAAPLANVRTPDIIANLLPSNPTASIVQGDMLAVVVLAILVGLAATQVSKERAAPFLSLLDALLSIAMVIVKWAMFLAPLAVFGLMAQLVMRIGLSSLGVLWSCVWLVAFGLLLVMLLYLLLVSLFGGISPLAFLKASGGNLLLAFSSSSSSAVLPVTLETAVNRLKVPASVANIVVPLCSTVNMAGTALYQSIAVLFLAQISGIELSIGQMAAIVLTLVSTTLGAPGTPGVSVAILASVAASYGIPLHGLVIILGVDRILD